MKPLFTVHAGEFLVGCEIERKFPNVNVWVPAKDIGVDLLVTNKENKKSISLQVKFSRDYPATHKELRASGWWTPTRQKIETSPAEYWIFVLVGLTDRSTDARSTDFIIIKPDELLKRLDAVHGQNGKKPEKFQSYLLVTKKRRCWETRGLNNSEKLQIAEEKFKCDARDFTTYLNNWKPITDALNE
jgi:hypothetical protein